MADPVVVDTNVLVISEGMNGEASDHCVAACVRLVRRIQEGELLIVVDELDEILSEYLGALGGGSSGVGAKVAKRLRSRAYDASVCRRVAITPIEEPPGSYEEVPDFVRDFDNDDQKFLAVAKADPERPLIYAGLDRAWWCRRTDLTDAGFDVQFPCSDDLHNTDC